MGGNSRYFESTGHNLSHGFRTYWQNQGGLSIFGYPLSEEFTEIHALAAQQMKFRQMGDEESTEIARMYGRWIREHKAGLPMLARLIRLHGADPATAKELKAPVLGTKMEMLQ